MFTKNKVLLGLALALFTFAAPNRAQALPHFFPGSTKVATTTTGVDIWSSPDFGLFSISPFPGDPYGFPYIYKWGFGWVWWNSAYENAYGGVFWDLTTKSYFYTYAQYYNWHDIFLREFCGTVGGSCIPDYTTYTNEYTYFYSYTFNEWLLYYDAPRNHADNPLPGTRSAVFRHFQHTNPGYANFGHFDFPPCWTGCVGGG